MGGNVFYTAYSVIVWIFFSRFYLFIHDRQREKGRHTGRRRSRLPTRNLMKDSIPGPRDHNLSQTDAQPLSHPGAHYLNFFFFYRINFSITIKIFQKKKTIKNFLNNKKVSKLHIGQGWRRNKALHYASSDWLIDWLIKNDIFLGDSVPNISLSLSLCLSLSLSHLPFWSSLSKWTTCPERHLVSRMVWW